MKNSAVIRSARIPFLVLTPVCIFLGASIAVANQASIDMRILAFVLAGALLAHISVNLLNEYHDFKSGIDLLTVKTPFSGGSGALPENPHMANRVLTTGILSLLACAATGLYLYMQYGTGILPVGIAGLLLIITYTRWVNRHPVLCLIAPGTGFGLLMVTGTQFLLEGEYSATAVLAGGVPFFLVNNLLLLNQYPDIEADASAGRRTLPIVYGSRCSNHVYATFILATIALIVLCIALGIFPMLCLLSLLPMPLAFYALRGAILFKEKIGAHPKYLASNVILSVLTPFLLGLGIIYGAT
jgi:1,4-dihydroxy-2-naphthoate octaprenyltransferase